MTVTRAQIVKRGLTNRCSNCGHRTLFPPKSFRVRRLCPDCGTGFDRSEGFFLGPWILNYTVAVFVFVLPAIVAGARGMMPWSVLLTVAAVGCTVAPVVLY